LKSVGAQMIALKRGDSRRLLAFTDTPGRVDRSFDLRERRGLMALVDAADALFAPAGRILRVVDAAPAAGETVEIVLEEAPLKAAMLRYSQNILLLSLVISVLTASLVYVALNGLLVRPMQRLTRSMVRFRENPEDPSRIVQPSGRSDEIGQAERELAAMQTDLRDMLRQKSRLASLGLAVSKISHDLRNLLASVQILGDNINSIEDPRVQRFAPKLIRALDRAVSFCQSTLAYGQAREAPPERRMLPLKPFADEVAETVGLMPDGRIRWINAVKPDLMVDADPDQLFRVLLNLVRNGVNALEGRGDLDPERDQIRVAARREGAVVIIEISDTGPGVAEHVKPRLFEAFQGSTTPGGTGLGLAIAAELVRAHGGDIHLVPGTLGATFQVSIPDRVIDIAAKRLRRESA